MNGAMIAKSAVFIDDASQRLQGGWQLHRIESWNI
jgi:hypothetical protein